MLCFSLFVGSYLTYEVVIRLEFSMHYQVMNHTVSADHLLGEVATNIPDVSEGELEYCLKLMQYNSETEGFVRFKVRHYADVRAI